MAQFAERPTAIVRPRLPKAAAVAAYLERLDETRWYTNRGELVGLLERRLAAFLGWREHAVVTASSGTAALEAAILATAGPAKPERPLALMPSYTFAATALAAQRCGYRPYFLDIDPDTWAIPPAVIEGHPHLGFAGVIIPVAPYGRAPDVRAWEQVHERTGVPVVIDAAAAFEQLARFPDLVSETVPLALSFHATKTFSTGEGGGVFWRNEAGQLAIAQITNFGMDDARQCVSAGFNGKTSEYHAAVGLAMLDEWPDRANAYGERAWAYAHAAAAHGVSPSITIAPEVSSAYVLAHVPARRAGLFAAALGSAGFATRAWYGRGLHRQAVWRNAPRDPLPITEALSPKLVGVPTALDMSPATIDGVVALIARQISAEPAEASAARLSAH